MSPSNYTRNILNIKDENIIFEENFLKEVTINDCITKFFHGKLTYNPSYCPKCGCIYNPEQDNIIKYGFKKNCKIKIDKVSNFKALLLLDKQRFYCKECHSTFIATTNLVDFHKQISNNTKLSITLDLMRKGSEKDIAYRNNVSSSSVNRILNEISKDTKSKMAFIIVSQEDRNIFDINNSRLSLDIEHYFKNYSRKERNKVKFITMDLYKPYYKLMSKLFRNAVLIPDRFHIVIQVRDALDKTRIKLCYKSNPNYKKLKKYWKLILKNEDELDDKNKKYNKHFKKEMTQKDIVTYLINTDDSLFTTYNLYQGIIKSIDKRDKQTFLNIIHNVDKSISKYAKKAIKTFINMKKYIVNAFDYEYSNGIVEGTNNLIKQIKHTACGYRKFSHLKARVMLIKGLFNPIKAN